MNIIIKKTKMLGSRPGGNQPINKLLEKLKMDSNESAESGISLDLTPHTDKKETFEIKISNFTLIVN